MAIVGAILAAAGRATPARPLAILPAFTFPATAAAVQQCGYEVHLADVHSESWLLDPQYLTRHPVLCRTGLVVPVAPFGRPVPQAAWRRFRDETDIPVVIDGAPSFDTLRSREHLGDIPIALSFHATKSFATGEGGAVVCSDVELIERVASSLNFGFCGSRDSRFANTNGKMSEYNAAVGLAELDDWPSKHAASSAVLDLYRAATQAVQLSQFLCGHPAISTCYALLICRTAQEAEDAEHSLDERGIDCRRWYGRGLQGHTYFAKLQRDPLHVTEGVLQRLIGLPVAPDLGKLEVERVVAAIRPVLSQ
jgi:dTDP-4-amino-4,6-dideoxygalactose transaminase